jgi:hypothetical protein
MNAAIVVLLILALASPVYSQEQKPPQLLTFFSYTATLSIFTDTIITYDIILNHNCVESNPLWRPIMKYPPLVMTLDMGIATGITLLADHLYRKDHKTLAWVLLIAVNVGQAYVIIHNLRLARL